MNDGEKSGIVCWGPAASAPARSSMRMRMRMRMRMPMFFGRTADGLRRVMLLLVAVAIMALAAAPSIGVPTAAELQLRTTPEGATVFLNGRLVGVSPVNIASLRLGAYGVRIEKDGYIPVTKLILLGKVGSRLEQTLAPLATARMTIDAKPGGAEVLLDGELQGHTPLNLEAVPIGGHELVVRKTNFRPFARQIELAAGEPQIFRFELDDIVLEMLNNNIAKENTRVAHYMDFGHYLFVNDRMAEASGAYAKALEVSATPLTFEKDVPPAEQALSSRLRGSDRDRLASQIGIKESWPGKDVSAFTKSLEGRRWELIEQHIKEWGWVSEQAGFYSGAGKLDDAQKVLMRYIDVNKSDKNISLDSPQLTLLTVRVKARKLPPIQESGAALLEACKANADLLRQAGDTILTGAPNAEAKDREAMWSLAERFYRAGIEAAQIAKNTDMQVLCQFQLGSALALAGKLDEAIAMYRTACGGTKDPAAREPRLLKLVETLRSKHDFEEAKKILNELAASPRANIASKAKQELDEIASVESTSKTK